MTIQDWGQAVTDSLIDLWIRFINFVPLLIGALLVLLVGWFVAVALGKFIAQILRTIRLDQALESAGLSNALEKANVKGTASGFLGGLVKWFLIIVFLMAAADILRLEQIGDFLNQVLAYIPQLVIAVIILLAGALLSKFVASVVLGSVKAAGFNYANFLATVARWAIMIFSFLAALDQLGIAPALVRTLFTGIIALLAIAGGLAFGLGGKDLAGELLNRLRHEIRDNHTHQ